MATLCHMVLRNYVVVCLDDHNTCLKSVTKILTLATPTLTSLMKSHDV